MTSTRRRLVDGALRTIREQGITAVSARTVAAAAESNQALIFYHFGTLEELLAQACLITTGERVAAYRDRFADVATVGELLELGSLIQAEERAEGNLTVLAQALAGAQGGGRLAEATRQSLGLWIAEVEGALTRVLTDSPLAELVDAAGLARAVSAGYLGLTLFESVDEEGGAQALAVLEQLTTMIEVVDGLGPVATRAVRARLRRSRR